MHRSSPYCIAALLLCVSGPLLANKCLSHPKQGAIQRISFGTVAVSADARPGTVLA